MSIGDVAINPTDPNVVWVGTGEANNRQSSSWGDGIYKSTDGGKTWKNMGLRDSHHIGRIIIDPQDTDIVYVAAVGRLWGANKERGVFKTTDGGVTWQHVLAINENTGATDLIMDPANPKVLIAAAYSRRRTGYGFNGGGPDSGIYKSTDAGRTWRKLAAGLPGWRHRPHRSRHLSPQLRTSSTPSSRTATAACSARRTKARRGPRSTASIRGRCTSARSASIPMTRSGSTSTA